MSEETIQEWLAKLPEHFVEDRAVGIDGEIQLDLSGGGGGAWVVTIREQRVWYEAGRSENARVTLSGAAEDVLAVLSGELDGMRAYITDRLKIKGDISFATGLMKVFKA